MFKQIKSALIWLYIIKFRRKLFFISIFLIVAFLSNYIYVDIANYLTAINKTHLLIYALLFKWLLIFFSVSTAVFFILSMFKPSKKEQSIFEKFSPKTTEREAKILRKESLKNQTDFTFDKFQTNANKKTQNFENTKTNVQTKDGLSATNNFEQENKAAKKAVKKQTFSAREKRLLEKRKLRSKADFIIEK